MSISLKVKGPSLPSTKVCFMASDKSEQNTTDSLVNSIAHLLSLNVQTSATG